MNHSFLSLAAIKAGDGLLDTKSMSSTAWEIAVMLFGLAVLVVGLFVWVMLFRKKPRHRHSSGRHHHHDHGAATADAAPPTVVSKPESRSSRKRRHHKFHRRFPTLAQTGGLPPKRSPEPEPARPPGSSAAS